MPGRPPPVPNGPAGQHALRGLLHGGVLSSLEALHAAMGNVFQLPLPGFSPVVLVGPEANRFIAVTGREDLRWRPEGDPVTRLLGQGLLVTDGPQHDELRRLMLPALHKSMLGGYVDTMLRCTDEISRRWGYETHPVDMLLEMRRLALLILTETLFGIDLRPHLERIWKSLLKTLRYISPGLWLVWPGVPRPGYTGALRQMDEFLFEIIRQRRQLGGEPGSDLVGLLISAGLDDRLIRDQLLTMLIAGHDTSTALLAWVLWLLGQHPTILAQVVDEVDDTLGGLPPSMESIGRLDYLEMVLNETLRLYPPIHLGQRRAACDLEFQGYHIPAGQRVVYSIYLTHRMPQYWPEPQRFDPQRFTPEQVRQRPHYTYIPFGGGPRNCIGLAFAQVEAKVIVARLLQKFSLRPAGGRVHPHMGATLEPSPKVMMTIQRR